MPRILKAGKVVATFSYDSDSCVFAINTSNKMVRELSKVVQGIKGQYLPETETMLSYVDDLKPGDPNYAFHFLSQLIELGYEVKE